MKRLRLLLFLTINILLLTKSFAQQKKLDNLNQIIASSKDDTVLVDTYLKLGDVYEYALPDTAIFYYFKALKVAEDSNLQNYIAKCSNYIGIVYSTQGNNSKALEYYEKALKIYYELENKKRIATVLGNIGTVYNSQGDFLKAYDYLQKSLKINMEIGDKKGTAYNLQNIGINYHQRSNYLKAIEYYKKALKIQHELGREYSVNSNLSNIGVAYNDFCDYRKAIKYQKKALQKSKELGDNSGIAFSLASIGVTYKDLQNYPKALEYLEKGLEIYKQLGYKSNIASILITIGNIYTSQSNYDKALEYYKKSLAINKKIEDKLGVSSNYINIGILFHEQGNISKALEYYKKALKIDHDLGNNYGEALCLGNIGVNYFDQGNYTEAIVYQEKAMKINQEIGNKAEVGMNLGNMGFVYAHQKEYSKALDYYKKASKINHEVGITNSRLLKNMPKAYWALNKNNKAAESFNNMLKYENKNIILNFSILSESAKELYFLNIEDKYWQYYSFVLQNKNSFPQMVGNIYNSIVKNKGLLLKSNTAMRSAIHSSNDSTLMQDYDNWVVIKTQIVKKYATGEDAKQLERKADSLEAILVRNSNQFSDFNKVQNIDWKQVQSNLKDGEYAIEFTHFPLLIPDSSYYYFTNHIQYVALILTKNSSQPEMIPLFEEKQLEKIIGKFGGNNYSYINSIYGKNNEVNTELYNLIWKPMEGKLEGAEKIYLSPSGLLHKISFSAIAKEQNVYLCDAYDIEIKSSTGKITEQARMHEIKTATLFGGITYDSDSTKQKVWNYLEGTKTETQRINKILKKGNVNINYYTNSSATEDEFKLMASQSNILHIATHGFFYPDPREVEKETEKKEASADLVFRGGSRGFGINSFVENINPLMRSGLVFAGANDVWSKQNKNDTIDDGVLTAQEVSIIDMRKTDLVVMSACETGLGDIKGSEGVYGLQRAFKMAGVQYEIMSLWQVPDKETEEFMTTFYQKLIKQKDLPDGESGIKNAFAETQKEMRAKYDPYFWAAFVLIE